MSFFSFPSLGVWFVRNGEDALAIVEGKSVEEGGEMWSLSAEVWALGKRKRKRAKEREVYVVGAEADWRAPPWQV